MKKLIPLLLIAIVVIVIVIVQKSSTPSGPSLPAATYLTEGGLNEGIVLKRRELKSDKANSTLRYELGLMLVYSAFEELYSTMHSYGMRDDFADRLGDWALKNLPDDTKKVTYDEFVALFDRFYEKLEEASEVLAEARDLKEPVAIPIGKIRLDLNGNDTVETSESLEMILGGFMGEAIRDKMDTTIIKFDQGDVTWLEGYCHLAMGLQDFIFHFDLEPWYRFIGNLIFEEVESVSPDYDIASLEIRMKERKLHKTRQHWLKCVALSKESWKFYMAETDDDHEWVPNPSQASLFESMPMTQPMVDSWLSMLEELEMILNGEKLLPRSRRSSEKMGFNLQKFFDETRSFNLKEWTEKKPYLEAGETTSLDFWNEMTSVFPSSMGLFAFWIN